MGSYNYFGFAENTGKCADDAEHAVIDCGLGICSSRHELGLFVVFCSGVLVFAFYRKVK